MSEQPAPSKRRLTRAQVVVLVVLVGILVLLLARALDAARERARLANCLSNLHGIGCSVMMYADLYGGRCPDAGIGKPAHDHLNLVTNVTASGKIFVCPSDRLRTSKGPFRNGDALARDNLSYGYIAGLKWRDNPDSVFMFDRGLTGTTKGSGWRADSPHGRKGGNQLFLDGHVQFGPTLIQTLKGDTVVTDP